MKKLIVAMCVITVLLSAMALTLNDDSAKESNMLVTWFSGNSKVKMAYMDSNARDLVVSWFTSKVQLKPVVAWFTSKVQLPVVVGWATATTKIVIIKT
jgi:hypothetical protein